MDVANAGSLAATLTRDCDRALLLRTLATLRTEIKLFECVDQLRWNAYPFPGPNCGTIRRSVHEAYVATSAVVTPPRTRWGRRSAGQEAKPNALKYGASRNFRSVDRLRSILRPTIHRKAMRHESTCGCPTHLKQHLESLDRAGAPWKLWERNDMPRGPQQAS